MLLLRGNYSFGAVSLPAPTCVGDVLPHTRWSIEEADCYHEAEYVEMMILLSLSEDFYCNHILCSEDLAKMTVSSPELPDHVTRLARKVQGN